MQSWGPYSISPFPEVGENSGKLKIYISFDGWIWNPNLKNCGSFICNFSHSEEFIHEMSKTDFFKIIVSITNGGWKVILVGIEL